MSPSCPARPTECRAFPPSNALGRSITRLLTLPLALALSSGVAGTATAQEVRTTTVTFASASATANGYLHGSIRLRYAFDGCGDVPQLFFSLEAGSARGYEGYWYEGKFYGLQSDWTPPAAPALRAPMRVMFGGRQVPASDLVNPYTSPTSCSTGPQYRMLGQWRDFIPTGGDREEAIKRFTLEVGQVGTPLRSDRVEQMIRTQLAAAVARARTDSLERARLAREAEARRLAAARADSVARADAAKRTAATSTTAIASATAGTASGAATGTSAASSGTTSGTAAQRARDAEAAEQRERQAAADAAAQRASDAEHARRVEAERQRVQAEQERQLVTAVEATTVAAIGIFEAIAESRRVNAEKKRVRAEIARREADAAFAAYAAAAKARYDAAPPRPTCSGGDVRDSVVVTRRTQELKLRLSGEECRLAEGQSAILMTLIVDADAPVSLTTSTNPVLASVHLVDARTNRSVTSRFEGGFSTHLEAGRYVMVVSSRLPGEVGAVTLTARKLWVSDGQGTLGGAMSSAQPIDGFVGTNQTSSAFMDLSLGLQHRRRYPYLLTSMLLATDTEAAEAHVDVGLQQYIGRTDRRLSTWVGASVGYRMIMVREEPFTTISPAFSAGLNYRLTPGTGLALSATQITGSARNDDDIWTSPPPPVPLGRTLLRVGLIIY
jgi:hypothetical protein